MRANYFLIHYLALWKPVSYLLVFVAMMFEGDLLLFTTAFLTQQGLFKILYIFPIVFAGALAGDLLWYWAGYEINKLHISISFVKRWMEHLAQPLDNHLETRLKHTIFVSKFAYGFNHLTLLRAGMKGIHLGDFIKANVSATIVWMFAIGILGYLSGASFELIKRYIRFAEILLFVALVIFFAFWHFVVTKKLKRKL